MDAFKLPIACAKETLKQDLLVVEQQEWLDHFVPDNYRGTWQILTLRGPKGETHPIRLAYSNPSQSDFEDTPLMACTPNIKALLSMLECPINSVRLMKLTSRSYIKEHTDYDLALDKGFARLHVPIVTHPAVNFIVNGNNISMLEGECWYLNLALKHSVKNNSPIDRVHLVIDVVVNDWLRSLVRLS